MDCAAGCHAIDERGSFCTTRRSRAEVPLTPWEDEDGRHARRKRGPLNKSRRLRPGLVLVSDVVAVPQLLGALPGRVLTVVDEAGAAGPWP